MSSSEIALCFGWFISLWLLGWAMLPYSRRFFPRLPDEGLAAGRILFVVLASLFCFWGASFFLISLQLSNSPSQSISLKLIPLHLISLQWAPAIFLTLAISAGWGWLKPANRALFLKNRRNLLISDAVFALSYAFFLWIRLKNPNVNDLEKPMDMALIAAAMRADFLPFQHPWFSGTDFTNYYYFGHLMAALLSKALLAAPHYAYNLVLVAFCAFFLSTLWSIGAALTKSVKYGLGVALLVGIGGHLEPLRQISTKKTLWPLDWWTTSRVISNTINEYPAFTMGIGDLHGHFFALSFAALWFCLVFSLFEATVRRRITLLATCGLVLGAWLMTNTWDAPLFGLLFAIIAWLTGTQKPAGSKFMWVGSFVLAVVTALPYFLRFKSQVKGVQSDFWIPDPFSFVLLWGSWWMLGCAAQFMPRGDEKQSKEAVFRLALIGVGLVALVAPYMFYIRGYFGDGDLRHQDTVFKFGSQAWLLLGLGISSEFFIRFRALPAPQKLFARPALATFIAILMLSPLAVFYMRAIGYAAGGYSLNGMKFLSQADQKAVLWLQNEAPKDTIILQNAIYKDGDLIGDYDGLCGRMATFSGAPTPLGWPQHVWMWGAKMEDVNARGKQISEIYQNHDWKQAKEVYGANYVFFAEKIPAASNAAEFDEVHTFDGDDGSVAQILKIK